MDAFTNAQKAMEEKETVLKEIRGQYEKYKKDSAAMKKELEDVNDKKTEEEKRYEDRQRKVLRAWIRESYR